MTKDRFSAGYSITLDLVIKNQPGMFGQVVNCIANSGASLGDVRLVSSDIDYNRREVTASCKSEDHAKELVKSIKAIDGIKVYNWRDDTFHVHEGGKLTVEARFKIENSDQMSRVYTPGVARVCMAIHANPSAAYRYTIKRNSVAVVTDGTAVLGLGDIGPKAAMPVMEGKAILFKQFAGIDSYPICLDTKDTEEIIKIVKAISPGFAGINLEDISAPRCFEIERRLQEELDIPVFHDDQHGTAIVVMAAIFNAMKLTGKTLSELKVVVNGFGASGISCAKMMLQSGIKNVIGCDTTGAIFEGREEGMNEEKISMSKITNPNKEQGKLADILKGADIFLGLSKPGVLTAEMVKTMNKDPIIFALANPNPEISPSEVQGIARIIATGRSDYPNQINNVLAFPGIFRGALDSGAKKITENMKLAAAHAIADSVKEADLREDYIIPGIFKSYVSANVAERVKQAAIDDGVASIND